MDFISLQSPNDTELLKPRSFAETPARRPLAPAKGPPRRGRGGAPAAGRRGGGSLGLRRTHPAGACSLREPGLLASRSPLARGIAGAAKGLLHLNLGVARTLVAPPEASGTDGWGPRPVPFPQCGGHHVPLTPERSPGSKRGGNSLLFLKVKLSLSQWNTPGRVCGREEREGVVAP